MNDKISRAALAARYSCHEHYYLVSVPEDHILWSDIARAVLASVYEPTEAMCDAAHSDCWWVDMSPLTVWQAMMNEMLK